MEDDRLKRLTTVLSIAFVAALCLTAVLAYTTVRDLVASTTNPGVTGFEPSAGTAAPAPTGLPPLIQLDPAAPLQASGPDPKPWDGESRVTVLLMGLDFRDWEGDTSPSRTDTLILMTLDPQTGTAGMLSIPRDLWVNIPNFESGKINTAYQLGEIYDVEGGGAALAIETVENLLGVPINYYALVDFGAFVRFIDEIGGVKIDIPDRIGVDLVGAKNFRVLQPGIQTLSGEVALAYVRARNTAGGDFDRAARQQQVLIGIRDRILDFDLLPHLISRAPVLYNDLADSVRTNLNLEQGIRLAVLALQVPKENITRAVIDNQYVTIDKSPLGLDILTPIPDRIRLLRDDVFSSPGSPINPIAEDKTPAELMLEEGAEVAILNGTQSIGLASLTTELLVNEDVNVTITDNASQFYKFTTIIDYTGNPYTLQFLIEFLDINPNRIFHSYDPDSDVDIELNLGDDWAKRQAQNQ
jgi:LCP family protein required for cell wall assembly